MVVRSQKPLLNVLDRQEFTDWLQARADAGDVAGRTGGVGTAGDPIENFLESKGWKGRVNRFEFYPSPGQSGRGSYRIPGWATEFLAVIDREPFDPEDIEDDGVSTLVSAERCLEIMEAIPW